MSAILKNTLPPDALNAREVDQAQDHPDFLSATFHVVEGRHVAGHLTWHGLEVDAENDGPLALIIRDMGIAVDQTYTIAEDTAMQVDPLTVDDPWARNRA